MLDLNRGKPLVLVYCVNVARFLAVMHRKWTRRLARKLSSSTHEPFKWLKFLLFLFCVAVVKRMKHVSVSIFLRLPCRFVGQSDVTMCQTDLWCLKKYVDTLESFVKKILAIVLLYPTESKKIPLYFKKWIIYPLGRPVQPIICIVWQNSEENCYLPVVCHTTLSNVLLTMKLK